MDLNAVVAAVRSHNWLLLVMFAAMYARTLFSDKSKFPKTLSPNWLPVFSGIAGSVVIADTALMGGKDWQVAAMLGVAGFVGGGFLDGMASAFFGDPAKVPTWAKMATGLIDSLFGHAAGVSVKQVTTVTATTGDGTTPTSDTLTVNASETKK
jgi:hypothetical protein